MSFHTEWSSPDDCKRDKKCNLGLLERLSKLGGCTVAAVCSSCRRRAFIEGILPAKVNVAGQDQVEFFRLYR